MKTSSLILLLWSLLILGGCNYSTTIPESTTTNTTTGTENNTILTGEAIQAPLIDTIGSGSATLFFDDNNLTKTFTLYHQAGQKNNIYFINDGYKTLEVKIFFLSASLISPNLRLSQIVMPDGTMDGPFSTETTYDLTQNGWYQLIFNENMMAWDPWSGDATFSITLSK